ncbi:MAG: N-6 DNA methylase [Bacteroidales bacterium]
MQNVEKNIPNVMFTIERSLIEIISSQKYQEWVDNNVHSESIVATITNPTLRRVFDAFTETMQIYNNQNMFKIFYLFESVDKQWFDDNFSEIFEFYYSAAQARRSTRAGMSAIHGQPKEITKLISTVSGFNGGSVYNPFAGVGSYDIEFTSKASSYYGQELDKEAWAVGYLRLLANNISTKGYVCDDSIDNWAAYNPNNQNLPKFDFIVATPPWGMPLNRNIGSECESYNSRSTVDEYFLMRGKFGLSDKGKLAGLFSSKILFAKGGASEWARKSIVREDILEMVITLPEKIFLTTSIPPVLIILSKCKPNKGFVKMVDGSSFFEKRGQNNILDIDNLLSAISIQDNKFVKEVPSEDIITNEYNITPAIYIHDIMQDIEVPEGYALKALGEFVEIYPQKKKLNIFKEMETSFDKIRLIRGKDLSDKRYDIHRDFAQLELEESKQSAIPLYTNLLLMLSVGRLKPTLFDYTEGLNVYVNNYIMAFVVDTTKIHPDYLADELGKEYVAKQVKVYSNGVAMQSISRVDMLKIKILVPETENVDFDEILKKQKLDYSAQRIAELAEEIELIKSDSEQKFEHMLRSRRHAMNQVLNALSPAISSMNRCIVNNNLGDYVVASRTGETIADYIGKLESNVSKLINLVGGLLNDNEFGVAEKDVWVSSFINEYAKLHPAENFVFLLSPQLISYNDLPYIEEIYDNNGNIINFRVKEGEYILRKGDIIDTYAIDINRQDFLQVLDNIISNAKKYGFTDADRKDYVISLDLQECTLANGKDGVIIIIRNNGNPLSADLKPEDVFKWSVGNGEGIGGAQVKDIVEHFGGHVELIQDVNNDYGFCIEYRLTFPISNSNSIVTL